MCPETRIHVGVASDCPQWFGPQWFVSPVVRPQWFSPVVPFPVVPTQHPALRPALVAILKDAERGGQGA